MHPELKKIYLRSVERMKADDRVLAGLVFGSARTAHEDEFSDVDAIFIVRTESFADIIAEIPGFFAQMCDTVELVWAERFNTPEHHNYAVLMRSGENLLQYDISIDTETFRPERKILPAQLLFDKAGCLSVTDKLPLPQFTPDKLRRYIEAYWIWIYIHAKYLRRRDFIKLLCVQQELFNNHIAVLRSFHESARAYPWWPQALKALPDTTQQYMLSYLTHTDIHSIREKLPGQIAAFTADARSACACMQTAYPDSVESAVLEHLYKSCPKLKTNQT